MQPTTDPIGDCPTCGESLPAVQILIEYERSTGEPDAYAECPGCSRVVSPSR